MRPSLIPRLVNSPLEDPALFIRFLFENKAILFDLGEIQALPTRDVLKLSLVFVSHTHMDHFAGFDRLLRLFLGRDKMLTFYGPAGFMQNVEGKLAGYQWNLVSDSDSRFALKVTEVHSSALLSQTYACRHRFQPSGEAVAQPFSNLLVEAPSFCVHAAILDHRIPCLGLCIEEKFHINIKKDALQRLRLAPGPWLKRFKNALLEGLPSDSEIEIPSEGEPRQYALGALSEEIALITPGQKIAYVTDVAYSVENVEKIAALAAEADHLFLEAAFLDKHAHIAAEKNHLTARQAGEIAALARAKRFTPFHFSPRYTDCPNEIVAEAMQAYESASKRSD